MNYVEHGLESQCKELWRKLKPTPTISRHGKLVQQPEYAILIVLDGVSRKMLESAHTPNIEALKQQGVFAESCHTVFPSLSSPAHVSIATGAYPMSTGYVPYEWGEGEYLLLSQRMNLAETLAEATTRSGYLSAAISESSARGADIRIGEFVCGDDTAKVTENFEHVMLTYRPNLVHLSYYCTDDIAERFGPESKESNQTIEFVDKCIGRLLQTIDTCGIREKTVVALTADHGMTSVRQAFSLEKLSEYIGGGIRLQCLADGRSIALECSSIESELELVKKLSRFDGVDYVFTNHELRILQTEIPKGNIVLSLKEQWAPGQDLGNHGGFTETEMNVPLIMCGCGIRTGARIEYSATVDIAPTLAFLLGVAIPKNCDGRLLSEALDGQFSRQNVEEANRIRRQRMSLIEELKITKAKATAQDMDVVDYADEIAGISKSTSALEQAWLLQKNAIIEEAYLNESSDTRVDDKPPV